LNLGISILIAHVHTVLAAILQQIWVSWFPPDFCAFFHGVSKLFTSWQHRPKSFANVTSVWFHW